MHVGQLSYSTSHIRECTFNPANLPDFLRSDVEKEQGDHDTSHAGNHTFYTHNAKRMVFAVKSCPFSQMTLNDP